MTEHHQKLASELVEQFRQSLSEEARASIPSARFQDLEQSVSRLLSHEHNHIAAVLEAYARTLRSGADKLELEL